MALFNQDTQNQLKDIFKDLKDPVTIALFTGDDCQTCPDTLAFMEELENLSDKLVLRKHSLDDKDQVEALNIERVPAIVLLDQEGKNRHMKFYGIPAGHEINSFISGLMEVSGAGERLPSQVQAELDQLDKKVKIKVFVTLSCPHCSGAVSKAHKLAFENENIEAEMIECSTFPDLANQYQVQGVPKIVFNDREELVGNQPLDQFISAVLKA